MLEQSLLSAQQGFYQMVPKTVRLERARYLQRAARNFARAQTMSKAKSRGVRYR